MAFNMDEVCSVLTCFYTETTALFKSSVPSTIENPQGVSIKLMTIEPLLSRMWLWGQFNNVN